MGDQVMYLNNPKKYREIEHTADVGICASGKNLPELFANAAFAMRNILFGYIEIPGNQCRKLKIIEANLPELIVRWLSELNFQLIVKDFIISKIEELKIATKNGRYYLFAQLQGDSSQSYLSHLNYEIKAVTYHRLKIEEVQGEFITQIIFDI